MFEFKCFTHSGIKQQTVNQRRNDIIKTYCRKLWKILNWQEKSNAILWESKLKAMGTIITWENSKTLYDPVDNLVTEPDVGHVKLWKQNLQNASLIDVRWHWCRALSRRLTVHRSRIQSNTSHGSPHSWSAFRSSGSELALAAGKPWSGQALFSRVLDEQGLRVCSFSWVVDPAVCADSETEVWPAFTSSCDRLCLHQHCSAITARHWAPLFWRSHCSILVLMHTNTTISVSWNWSLLSYKLMK